MVSWEEHQLFDLDWLRSAQLSLTYIDSDWSYWIALFLNRVCSLSEANYCSNPFEIFKTQILILCAHCSMLEWFWNCDTGWWAESKQKVLISLFKWENSLLNIWGFFWFYLSWQVFTAVHFIVTLQKWMVCAWWKMF